MPPRIQCWFDFASAYSYIAVHRAEMRVLEYGLDMEWKPFLQGPGLVLNVDGGCTTISTPTHDYMWRDMERLCYVHGLPFHRPSRFPRSGILAARIVCGRMNEWWALPFVREVFHANFVEDLEVQSPQIIEKILKKVGVDPVPLLAAARTMDNKRCVRQNTEEATMRGVFGAPSFTVGSEVFWGNERLYDAISWALKEWASESNAAHAERTLPYPARSANHPSQAKPPPSSKPAGCSDHR